MVIKTKWGEILQPKPNDLTGLNEQSNKTSLLLVRIGAAHGKETGNGSQKAGVAETHLTDGLELFTLLIEGRQQEAAIAASTLAPAQVGANHHEVQGVAQAL